MSFQTLVKHKNLDPWVGEQDEVNLSGSSWANLTALRRAANALLHRLQNDTGGSIRVGIGRYHPGIRGLARSYEDARAALFLGNHLIGKDQVGIAESKYDLLP